MGDVMRITRGLDTKLRSGGRASLQQRLNPTALMVAAAFGALTTVAHANPEGAKVVSGQATITSHGNTLVIKNSPGAIINWQSFSIGAGQTTDFIQQSVNSAILNRVVGADPSIIIGTLESNGRIFLVNPNGVVFGKGATVDAAGLVVSSLDITDADFKNGTLRFVGSAAAGDISVAGVLRSSDGDVYLIAPNVTNSGSITATNGAVVLAAGQDVEILGAGLNDIQFNVQNKGNTAINLGQINGDAVGIFAGTLTQAGGVNATTASVSGGKVVLSALGDVTLASGSSTAADNGAGSAGSILVQSVGGNISVASGASVSASGASGGSITLLSNGGSDSVTGRVMASGTLGLGGTVDILGQSVSLGSTALVDASGATGGGQLVVGGLAKSTSLLQSTATAVDSGAVLSADATSLGDGGHVVVFGSDTMGMDGSISARGGINGGNGGLIETSGEVISIGSGAIAANARAAGGKAGTWLLDPGSVDINATGTDLSGTANGTISSISASSIASALQDGENVVIQTVTVPGTTSGATITVDAPIVATGLTTATMLSLSAGGGITINQGITGMAAVAGAGSLALVLASGLDAPGTVAPIVVNAPLYLPSGSLAVNGDSFTNVAGNTITALQVDIAVTGTGGIVNNGHFAADLDSNNEHDGVGNGGNIYVSSQNGPITTGSMNTNSSGGTQGSIQLTGAGIVISSALSVSDEGTGSGGTVTLQSTNGMTSIAGASITANGGTGASQGGNGGSVTLSNTGAGITNLSGLTIIANGVSGLGGTGGQGGVGGSVTISSTALPISLTNVSITANGGDGTMSLFGNSSPGGSGGHISISGGAISINGGTITAQGGAGSAGSAEGDINNGDAGASGGVGGSLLIYANGLLSDTNTTIITRGGVGGIGGNYTGLGGSIGMSAGSGGDGGNGGSIETVGNGGTTLTGVTYQTIGGAGGAGGQVTAGTTDDPVAFGGNGGAGGDGGSIAIEENVASIAIVNSSFSMTGGAGGAAIESPTHAGFGGSGGAGGGVASQSFVFNLTAAGGITIDNASHITVQGGAGGVGAPGFETNNNASGYSTQAGNGGIGGNISGILINGSGGLVSLAGTILIEGGAGGAGGNLSGTNTGGGSGLSAGVGGSGGSVGIGSSALGLSAFGGNLVHTGTISIIGGAGGAGGSGADSFVLPGYGGAGGNIGVVDIYTNQSANFAGTLSIIGGAGGAINSTVGTVSSGMGGGQDGSLSIEADGSGLNLGGIINLEAGAAGPVFGTGVSGGAGTLEPVYLTAFSGALTQNGGAIVSTSTPLTVNITADSISLNSPNNSIGLLNATAMTGSATVVSMINMEVQSIVSAGSITLVAANGTTGNLTVDQGLSTTAGYISLSAGSLLTVLGNLSSTSDVYIGAGTLALNGGISADNLISIDLSSGALANNGQSLSANSYVLNAAGGIGSAATPLTLTPPVGSSASVSGGSTGAGVYISAPGDLAVTSALALSAAGPVDLSAGGAVYNLGTISGSSVNMSGTVFASNFGVIDSGGNLTMTAPTVVTQGTVSAGSVDLIATDQNIVSGSLLASGDLTISGGAVQIGFSGEPTTVAAHNIVIAGNSLMVSPDYSSEGSGNSSDTSMPLVSISAAGTLVITTTGDASFAGGAEAGSYVSVTSVGNSTYNIGGNLSLTGGSGAKAYVLLDPTMPGSTMTINATNLNMAGGSGDGAYVAIQAAKDVIINATSGAVMLTQGTGKDADAVVVAGSGGSIVANTPSCINCVQTVGPQPIGDGVTEEGFYVQVLAAPPPAPAPAPQAPQPPPDQLVIDQFINDLITLLDAPVGDQINVDLGSTVLVDGSTDGCI